MPSTTGAQNIIIETLSWGSPTPCDLSRLALRGLMLMGWGIAYTLPTYLKPFWSEPLHISTVATLLNFCDKPCTCSLAMSQLVFSTTCGTAAIMGFNSSIVILLIFHAFRFLLLGYSLSPPHSQGHKGTLFFFLFLADSPAAYTRSAT